MFPLGGQNCPIEKEWCDRSLSGFRCYPIRNTGKTEKMSLVGGILVDHFLKIVF